MFRCSLFYIHSHMLDLYVFLVCDIFLIHYKRITMSQKFICTTWLWKYFREEIKTCISFSTFLFKYRYEITPPLKNKSNPGHFAKFKRFATFQVLVSNLSIRDRVFQVYEGWVEGLYTKILYFDLIGSNISFSLFGLI